ncbi:MAG: hypothetical protein ACRD82_14000, partial [Blastocatellia bacterium]
YCTGAPKILGASRQVSVNLSFGFEESTTAESGAIVDSLSWRHKLGKVAVGVVICGHPSVTKLNF